MKAFFDHVKRLVRTIFLLIIGMIAGVAALGIAQQISASSAQPEARITASAILERLEDAQDLVSMEYHYRNVGTYEAPPRELFGVKIPFTGKKAIVVYTGVIKGGVDVGDVRVELDPSLRQVKLRLPEGKVIAHQMDREQMEVYDESSSVFRPFAFGDALEFLRREEEVVEQEALATGFLDQAREQAGQTLKTFVSGMSGLEDYEILVEYMEYR